MFGLKRVFLVFFVVFFVSAGLRLDEAEAKPRKDTANAQEVKQTNGPACKAEILVEPVSGNVLFEQSAHEALPPASMVKMMVVYMVMKRVQEGTAQLSDVITASAFASKIGGSQVYLKQGEQFTLGQLLEAVVIQSANDAAVAIAEHFGGSSEGFVDMMNAEAQELGMKETEFHSPHGLPPGRDQKPDLVSAFDMAQLGSAIVSKFPQVLELSSKPTAEFRDGTFQMTNTNHLIRTYPGADGLKTGFYNGAGFCVTGTAKRNNVRMLAVVMGCENGKKRFAEASKLLSLGFSQYKLQKVVTKDTPAKTPVTVTNGTVSEVVPVVAGNLSLAVRTSGGSAQFEQKEMLCPGLQAPVAAASRCGYLALLEGGKEVGRVDFVVVQDVPVGGWKDKVKKLLHMK